MRNLRSYLIGALAAAALFVPTAQGYAQSGDPTPQASPHQNGDAHQLRRMTKQLNLTDEQQAKLKKIFETTKRGRERREAIMGILTDDQKAKFKASMGHGHGHSPTASPTSAPDMGE